MTVAELIEKLSTVEDKDKKVIRASSHGWEDIHNIEELDGISSLDGETLDVVSLW